MPDLGEKPLLYSARPSISVDGRPDAGLDESVISTTVTETTGGLYSAELVVGNWGTVDDRIGYVHFNRRVFDFGRKLSIAFVDAESPVFDGRITALQGRFPREQPPELLLLAEDRFQDLRMLRRSRTFDDVSDSDVFEQIAREHSLQPDVDVDGPQHVVLAQVNQSDLAFLRERAQAIDAEVWIEGETLHVQSRQRRRTGEVTLTYGEGLHEFAVTADLAEQRTSVAVSGWDVAGKSGIDATAAQSAVQSELNGDVSGASLLEQHFGRRPERLVHCIPLNDDEAQSLADARFREIARRFVSGRGLCEGDPRIRVGTHVSLRELGPMFDGKYYVCEAKHTFDPYRGYRTEFRAERAGIGAGP